MNRTIVDEPGARRAARAAIAPPDRAAERSLREEVRAEIGRMLDERRLLAPGPGEEAAIRALIAERVEAHQRRAAMANVPLLADPDGAARRLFDGVLRMGVLQPYVDDPETEEIICNGPSRVFAIARGRKRLLPDVYFDDDAELVALVRRLVGPLGRRLDESSPLVDARLPDGSRLNAAIPPATTGWCALTLRKFILRATSLEQLVALGTLSGSAARFLDAAVRGGVNILVSGPTGVGKTTFLNALGASIASPDERVITVEETAELQLSKQLPDCVPLQARAANAEGAGELTIRDLVRNALRMRPTRLLVGEIRGGEGLDVLTCMNTGHDGSMTSIHGASPRDALERLITLATMAAERPSEAALTKMVARTIEIVVQLAFDPASHGRRVASIYEVAGLETAADGSPVLAGHDLWARDAARDRLAWTGVRPRCLRKIEAHGVRYDLPAGDAGLEAAGP